MSTRASASLIRCFSLVISSNVDILYLRGKVLVDPDRSIFSASITTMQTAQQQNVRIYSNRRAVVGNGPQNAPGNEKAVIVQKRLRLACGRRRQESAALFDMTSRWGKRTSHQ